MLIIISIVLSIICVVLFCIIILYKKQADTMSKELKKTRDESYNRQLMITLFDGDMERLAAEVNNNLDYQKMLKLEADRSRRQLKQSVSDIAHDLRTPLTVVKGNLFMLSKEKGLSEHGRESLRISMEKTDALKEMVDDFFELSVLESDSSAAKLEQIDVTSFITQYVIDNETVIRQQRLTPKLILPEKSVFIMADEMLLTRMCNNLLNNIIKYAKDEFTVELNDDNEDSAVRLMFSNGISKDKELDVDRLFDRAYKGDKERPTGGAGLGLYIVKILADKQGAKVSAKMLEGRLCIMVEFNK